MQFWRQCYTVAWVVVLGVAGQAWAAPAWNAPTTVIGPYIKEQADLMKAAPTAAAAKAIRDDIELGLKPPKETGSPPPAWKSEYSQSVAKYFKPLVTEKANGVGLNAIILIADMKDTWCDDALVTALGDAKSSPAVRYWAARGLAGILPELKPIPPAFKRAVDALSVAAAKETSPLAKAEMLRAMKATGHAPFAAQALATLQATAAAFAKNAPTPYDMELAAASAEALTGLIADGATLNKADATAAAQAAADIMSFPAQYLVKAAQDKTQTVSGNQITEAYNLAQSALKVVTALAPGKTLELKKLPAGGKATADDLLSLVNDVTGSQADPSKIQALFPDVKAPARIK